jgi:hypothetical protein
MISGYIKTPIGDIPQVETRLNSKDILGAIKVRWLIGRDNYMVKPGLYAVGNPTKDSNVFVSANYKLSFDHVRKNLAGRDAWILVLDTKGVNVWCAAGKGTFGTHELVKRIEETQLRKVVNHHRLILPQLGATGVSAHLVRQLTKSESEKGFNVVWGPIKAADIKPFLKNNYKATTEMRRVTFTMAERTKLLPVDIVYAGKKLLGAFVLIFLVSGFSQTGYSITDAWYTSLPSILYIVLAYFTGILLTPILLPYIPFRMFALKGLITGIFLFIALHLGNYMANSIYAILAWVMLLPAISSFMAMNFTGGSTFTSLSGVKKEMKIFVPIQITMAIFGLAFYIINLLR